MDWSVWGWPVAIAALVFSFWYNGRSAKNADRADEARERLRKDTRLHEHIKVGMCEFNWRDKEHDFWRAASGQLLFETALMTAFHIEHVAETRVGFHFKDIEEFGLYSGFAGNGDEYYESFYRTDRSFQKEERLASWDE